MDKWREGLGKLDRGGGRPVTQQLVEVFGTAIADGELGPGAKLPPIRELARLAGINQLTAARCYQRLQEEGLVVAGVGRGTFVRTGQGPRDDRDADAAWQTYALPPPREYRAGHAFAAAVAQAEARDVVALSSGHLAREAIPLAELREAAAEVLADGSPGGFDYSAVEGTRELREQLALLGRERGLEDDPGEILVTTGARQGLTIAARAVLRPGDVVACESPTFAGVIEALRATGARLMPVPVDDGGMSIDALEQLLRSQEVRMVALQPRSHNPTGVDLEGPRRSRLLELAASHGFFVLEDAVYADLRYEGADPGALRRLDPARVIYIDSMSKTVAPGLRAGWIAASGAVLDRMVAEKREDDMHSTTLSQLIVARYLAGGHHSRQVRRVRDLYRERRDALVGALEEDMRGLGDFRRPAGGGHVWLRLKRAREDEQLYRAALGAGVSYVPGPAALVENPNATCMRLSFGALTPRELTDGVARLAAAVRAAPQIERQRETQPII